MLMVEESLQGLGRRRRGGFIKRAVLAPYVATRAASRVVMKRPKLMRKIALTAAVGIPAAILITKKKRRSKARRAVAAQAVPKPFLTTKAPEEAEIAPYEQFTPSENEAGEPQERARAAVRREATPAPFRAPSEESSEIATETASEEEVQQAAPEPESMLDFEPPTESMQPMEGLAALAAKGRRKRFLKKVARVAAVAAVAYGAVAYGAPLLAKALKGGGPGAAKAAAGSGQANALLNPELIKTAAGALKAKLASQGMNITDAEAEALAAEEAKKSHAAITQGKAPEAAGAPSMMKYIPIILPVFALAIAAMR